MRPRFRAALRTSIAALALATVIGHTAYGQDVAPAETAAPAANQPVPPKLVTFVEASYPTAAQAAGLAAHVDLDMTIDATGRVTDVRAVAPAGNGFDEAAVEAARKFVFEPARRGSQAIPARIRYRYVFALPAEPAPLPTTGDLEGRVLARGQDQAIAGATVTLVSPDGESTQTAVTDPSGAFHFRR
jgi:vitamin B12 transporter